MRKKGENMKDTQKFECSGDLVLEMQEVEKVYRTTEEVERGMTYTYICSGFLTIICC